MAEDDICGHITNNDEPCQFTPKYKDGKCGHHTSVDTGDSSTSSKGRGRPSKLNEQVVRLMADEIERGATIDEALAEVAEKTGTHISRSAHDNWMAEGKQPDSDGIKADYRSEVKRARRRGKRTDRETIKQKCIEKGDTRTWLEIHKMQYGDMYHEEAEGDERSVPFAVPEELIDEWQQLTTQ